MAREINLITHTRLMSADELRLRHLLQKFTPLGLAMTMFLLAVVFSASFYISQRALQVENRIEEEHNQIKAMIRNEGMYLTLKQKTQAIIKILAARFPYAETFTYLKSLETDKVGLKSIDLGQDGTVRLEVRAADSEALDMLVSSLTQAGGSRFNRVELVSVTLKNDGGYDMVFNLDAEASSSGQKS